MSDVDEQTPTDGLVVLVAIVLMVAGAFLLATGQTTDGLYVLGVLTTLAVGAFGIERHYE